MLDRLEKRRLVSRCRETKDRRMVLTRITPEGLSSWPGWMSRCRKRIGSNLAISAGNGCGR